MTETYERPCDLCGKISHSHADDYECKYCSIDHNECCYDKELDCCKECAEKIQKMYVPTELCNLAIKYGTDKWNFHHYTPHYHEMFKDRRNKVQKVLEIGIGDPASMADPSGKPYQPGASLRMWREYFPFAFIFALDNNPNILIAETRIISFLCDQGNEEWLKRILPELGTGFDLIVDDGSHVPEHQVNTAKLLVPLLAPHGIYVIEDVWEYPSQVGWSKEPFGLKLEDIPYKAEFIHCTPGNCDDRLVVIRA